MRAFCVTFFTLLVAGGGWSLWSTTQRSAPDMALPSVERPAVTEEWAPATLDLSPSGVRRSNDASPTVAPEPEQPVDSQFTMSLNGRLAARFVAEIPCATAPGDRRLASWPDDL